MSDLRGERPEDSPDDLVANRLRPLLMLSSALAAISLVLPLALWFAGWTDLAAFTLTIAFWCAIGTFFLLVAGLWSAGRKGLWLLIPAVVAFALPTVVIVSISIAFADCRERHDGSTCLP